MSTWDDGTAPKAGVMGLGNWALAGVRFVLVAIVIFGLMGPMVLLRVAGFTRTSQGIVRLACRLTLRVIGMRVITHGAPMTTPGGVVANHSTWLDIFVLNAVQRVLFVSKAEVAKWPLIGLIARSVGTVFIERKPSHAAKHRDTFQARLDEGHRLLFFPEGTSTDGQRVLDFKPTLFAAFFAPRVREMVFIQPVSVAYIAPENCDPRYYGWWGGAEFFPSFFNVLGRYKQGRIIVTFHPAVAVKDVANRKVLAEQTQVAVRNGLADTLKVG